MQLRDYQQRFVNAVIGDFKESKKLLGVAATGAGKTIMAAELCRLARGRVLFLADAQELVRQAADKIQAHSGLIADVEMGLNRACPSSKIIVGTTQSMARRLDKYSPDDFGLIIVDEAHRNTLGAQAMRVLEYFNARILGITATPFRSDKKQLLDFYEKISAEINLINLIAQGHLSSIKIKAVPSTVDLRKVRTVAGDYSENDLGEALEPELMALAALLKEHAPHRRTVAFLPLVRTSKMFCECCKKIGLHAVHVDGEDRAALRGDWQVICNASLLTTGWDEPSVDCVYILRPTKSAVLYSQMVGRGTRTFPGKENLLLLDPLFLSDDMSLIRPSRLIARTDEEAKSLQASLDLEGGDLLAEMEATRRDLQESMLEKARALRQRKTRFVDALDFAVSIDRYDIAEYEPIAKWERQAMSDKQKEILEKNGFDVQDPRMCKGYASKILDLIFLRREKELCTPKQLRFLEKHNYPNPAQATFKEASAFIEARAQGWKPKQAAK